MRAGEWAGSAAVGNERKRRDPDELVASAPRQESNSVAGEISLSERQLPIGRLESGARGRGGQFAPIRQQPFDRGEVGQDLRTQSSSKVDEDVLELGVLVQGVHAQLAADAGHLVAAERRLGVDRSRCC